MINKYYNLSSLYNKKIALFSDLHYSCHFDNTIFLKIISNLQENKPDYICIAGDIIDDNQTLKKDVLRNRLYKFIETLSKISKVIIIPGNHDLKEKYKRKVIYNYDKEYFEGLNNIKNVYYLDNKNIVIDNINFIGFNSNLDYYEKYKERNIEVLNNEFKKIKNKIMKEKYNVLLFHSPINILNNKMLDNIENIDLILSGHMHNGLVFQKFDKLKSNRGFIGPFNNFFPAVARNMKQVENNDKKITLIISGGIIKLSDHTKLTKFNKMFGMHIEYINI